MGPREIDANNGARFAPMFPVQRETEPRMPGQGGFRVLGAKNPRDLLVHCLILTEPRAVRFQRYGRGAVR
jgi:hypothetical protein